MGRIQEARLEGGFTKVEYRRQPDDLNKNYRERVNTPAARDALLQKLKNSEADGRYRIVCRG